MKFNCRTSNVYFTKKELEHLKEFEAANIEGSHVYTNKDGEMRMPTRFWWPKGWVNRLTVYIADQLNPHDRLYHTPLAVLEDSKEVRVDYTDKVSGEHGTCTSREWLKWLGDDFTKEVYDGSRPNPYMENYLRKQKENINNIIAAKKSAEEFDEETSGGDEVKWRKVTGRKKP